MIKIAVYGTLKKGQRLSGVMEKAKFICNDFISGQLYQFNPFYPHLSLNPPDPKQVAVEVYEVDGNLLTTLDGIELGAGYKRSKTKTASGIEVQVYELSQQPSEKDRIFETSSFPFQPTSPSQFRREKGEK